MGARVNAAHVYERALAGLLGHPPTLRFTLDACRALIARGIRGAFVECGVAYGSHPAVMAATAAESGELDRHIHLFDSFEGIPRWGVNDAEQPGMTAGTEPVRDGALATTGISACSLAQVRANLRAWGVDDAACVYHPGWFQHTVEPASKSIGPIAHLRLDGDLYESTRVCLEHLYPRVVPGAVVVVDDYALAGCRKAVDEYLAARGERPDIQPIDGGHGPVWWRR